MQHRYLEVGLSQFGGLNNHREVITMAAVIASIVNRTLVLPALLPNAHARPLPIENMWDIPRLSRILPVVRANAIIRGDRSRSTPSIIATPWCCDVGADAIRSSEAVAEMQSTQLIKFECLGGWGFALPYFCASLRRLITAIINCVRHDLIRCAAAVASRLRPARLPQRGRGERLNNELHAVHMRVGGKSPCPLMECEECGMTTRQLGGFQHRNCDCKKPRSLGETPLGKTPFRQTRQLREAHGKEWAADWSADGEGPILQETSWREARRDALARGETSWTESSASMLDAIECAIWRGQVRPGDAIYIATNQPKDGQVLHFTEGVEAFGLRVHTWSSLQTDLANAEPLETACQEALRAIEPSVMEQLLCASAPGRYFAHFVSSWDELVLHLRSSRRRNGSMSVTDSRGQRDLFESKLRTALDGGRPLALTQTRLEGRSCNRCHSWTAPSSVV
jgi:hypothetical protein